MNTRRAAVFTFAIISLCLSGCKDKDEAKAILPALDAAFPNSYILKVDPRLLWVQTQVGGISPTTAEKLYIAACQQATKPILKGFTINIQEELNIDGRQFLLVGFKSYFIGWDVRNGVDARGIPLHATVMDYPRVKDWLTQRIGYNPSKDQILMESLEDVNNTLQGQPMNLPTLSEVIKRRLEMTKEAVAKEEAAEASSAGR